MLIFCASIREAGSVFPVDIEASRAVGQLKDAIATKQKYDFAASKLRLYLAKKGDAWLPDDDPAALELEKGEVHPDIQALIDGEEMEATKTLQHWFFDKNGMSEPSSDQIHVLVVSPAKPSVMQTLLQQMDTVVSQDVAWYGVQGSVGGSEGINLKDKRTLSRSVLVADIIARLEETHVVLVKSPPMIGKTSLATLVSRALVDSHTKEMKKAAVFNLSVLGMTVNETLEELFKNICGVDLKYEKATLPTPDCVVYMVLD